MPTKTAGRATKAPTKARKTAGQRSAQARKGTARKAAAKKTTTTTTRKTASGAKVLSAAHKQALADGRRTGSIVDRYLASIGKPKQRGRKVSQAELVKRRDKAIQDARSLPPGVDKVMAVQNSRDLTDRINRLSETNGGGSAGYEAEFVRIAAKFSTTRGITYGSWREVGVPARVLQKAGIARTRGMSAAGQ